MSEQDSLLNKIAPYLEGVPNAHLRAVQIVNALAAATAERTPPVVTDLGGHNTSCGQPPAERTLTREWNAEAVEDLARKVAADRQPASPKLDAGAKEPK